MHDVSLPGVLPAILATLAFALYLVPPGFLLAGLGNLADFWTLSFGEKLCWSVALSFPVSTMLAVLLGHFAGAAVANPVFLLLAAAAILMAGLRHRQGRLFPGAASFRDSAPLPLALLATVFLGLFITAAVRVNGHLEEGAFTNDWYIRVPLQYEAGIASRVPPDNPLFTLNGQNPVLHYHYFFYILCAQPMRLFHLDARAVLDASVVWACLAFLAVSWLMLKYLAVPSAGDVFAGPGEASSVHRIYGIRRLALLFFGLSLVDGLNLIPNLVALLLGGRLYPTVYAWCNEGVATWPGTVAFGPHHMVGCASGLLGFLLLSFRPNDSRRATAVSSILAAFCFAAVMGTSAFIALAAVLATIAFGADALFRRQWKTAAAVTASLVLAMLLDGFFIVATILTPQAGPTAGAAPAHRFKLLLWEWHEAYGTTGALLQRIFHHVIPHGVRGYLMALPVLVLLYAIHFGFYLFVLWYRGRYDLAGTRKHHPLSSQGRALWTLFLTLMTLSLFISSAPMQHGGNDFGRDILTMSRIVLILWACPLAAAGWHRWRNGSSLPRRTRLAFGLAAACGVVGLASCAWDVVVQRIYLPLVDYGVVRSRDPFLFAPDTGASYAELSDAWQRIDRQLPSDAIVQHNPDGVLQRPALLYLNRRVAAGDIECETTFGGSPEVCVAHNSRPLFALYAQPEVRPDAQIAPDTGAPAFAATCAALRLSALIVTDYDPVWALGDSWVWREPVLYAGRHVRVLACPAAMDAATR